MASPSAVVSQAIQFRKSSTNGDALQMEATIVYTNPTPHHLTLTDVSYKLVSEGQLIISGSIGDAGSCQSHGAKTFNIVDTVSTTNARDLGNRFTYTFSVEITVNLPNVGSKTAKAEKKGSAHIV